MNEYGLGFIFTVGIIALLITYYFISRKEKKHKHG